MWFLFQFMSDFPFCKILSVLNDFFWTEVRLRSPFFHKRLYSMKKQTQLPTNFGYETIIQSRKNRTRKKLYIQFWAYDKIYTIHIHRQNHLIYTIIELIFNNAFIDEHSNFNKKKLPHPSKFYIFFYHEKISHCFPLKNYVFDHIENV